MFRVKLGHKNSLFDIGESDGYLKPFEAIKIENIYVKLSWIISLLKWSMNFPNVKY